VSRLERTSIALLLALAACFVAPFIAAEGAYLYLVSHLAPPLPPAVTASPRALAAFWAREEARLPMEMAPVSASRFVADLALGSSSPTTAEPGWHMASLVGRRWLVDRRTPHRVRGTFDHLAATLWLTRHWNAAQVTQAWIDGAWFGRGAYGLPAAALTYFGKKPEDLKLHELALLASLPQSPSRYDPACSPEQALLARDYVLGRLLLTGEISDTEHALAVAQPVHVVAQCSK